LIFSLELNPLNIGDRNLRTVSDVLHNAGGNVEYTTKDGKVIKIKYLTLKTMSVYENRLQNRAIKKFADQKDVIPSDIFKNMFGDLMDKIASGDYAFGGEICSKSLATVQGISDLVSCLCDISSDEALELLTNEGEAFRPLFDEVVRKSVSSKDDDGEGKEGNA